MTTQMLAQAGRFVLDLVYPPRCVLCGAGGVFLCPGCAAALPKADGDRCNRCWAPLWSGVCRHCAEREPAVTALRSAFRYEGDVRRLVHAFKFQGQSCLAEPLGDSLAHMVEDHGGIEADGLVPVPLRGGRQRRRGYNQASLLARQVGLRLRLPVLDLLARQGRAQPQAQSASAEQRRRNVEGAFSLKRDAVVRGLSLLLIDDVTTTGATLDACARVLLDAGSAAVGAATLARED
jgi:ComF family protein